MVSRPDNMQRKKVEVGWMTQITTVKLAVASGLAIVLLAFGAFLMISSMASAQTPPPSPTPQQQTTPQTTPGTPRQQQTPDGATPSYPNGGECDKDGAGQPDGASGASGAGSAVRGRGAPRTFAQ
jgi:hypothetical protein